MARAMKDSGVEWIGEIPEGWGVEPLKHLFSFGKGLPITKEQLIQEGLPVVSYGQIHAKSNTGTRISTDLLRYVSTEYAKLYPASYAGINTFIIADTSEDLEGCGNSVYNDSVATLFAGYHSIILRPSFTENARFYAYFFKSAAWRVQVQVQVSGVKVFSISQRILKNTVVLSPPKVEQQRIADFLDSATADIDASIAKTRESIEEYKKLKQAVITQAVTKGIRPGRAMKDSGVEWWPYISEDCEITRIGRVCTIILGKMLTPQPRAESDTIEPYFCAANVHFGRVDDVEGLKRMWFSPREKDDYLVTDEDMLVVEGGAGAGGAAIVKRLSTPAYIQNSIMIVRGGTLCDNRYVCYALESLVKRGYIDIACNKATIPHFTKEKVSATCIPYRSKEEQQEIAAYLDEKCGAIDDLIERKQAIITELEAYKKSLIYEYVTGKKEIPEGA